MNMNFANDGSFMAQFLAQQAAAAGSGAGGRQAPPPVPTWGDSGAPAKGKWSCAPHAQAGRGRPSADMHVGWCAGLGADTDRGAAGAGSQSQRRFTEEGGEGSCSRPKRKFVEEAEAERAPPRSTHGAGGYPAYDPAVDFASDVGKEKEDKEDDLVMSEWGKKYKVGFVPKSSHVGNLLPAEEMAKYTTLLPGGKKEEKKEDTDKTVLDATNAGYKMLSKMGWKAGKGLGAKEDGKVAPVGAAKAASDKSGAAAGSAHGVGSQHTWDLDGSEDVFEQYRKRMMLGYRHRPNPNGNPRKLYY